MENHVEVQATEMTAPTAVQGGILADQALGQVASERSEPLVTFNPFYEPPSLEGPKPAKPSRSQRRRAGKAGKDKRAGGAGDVKPAPRPAGKPAPIKPQASGAAGKPAPKGAAPKQAPAVKPTPPASPKLPQAPLYVPFDLNAKRYRPVVQSEEVRKRLAKLNILADVAVVPSTTDTPHPVSAAVRSVATVSVLRKLHKAGCRNVCSLYGSTRDASLLAQLNLNVAPENVMNLTIYRPLVTTADLNRRINASDLPPHVTVVDQPVSPRDFDGFFMVDVYEVTNALGSPVPLTPAWVLPYAVKGPFYWVGHDLRGACGTVENEGAWIQKMYHDEPRILHRPDDKSPPYPLHRSCDWWMVPGKCTTTAGTIGWNEAQRISDTVIVMAGELTSPDVELAVVENPPTFEWADLPMVDSRLSWAVPYLPNWIVDRMPKRRALVSLEMAQYLEDNYLAKQFSPYTWRQCLTYATNLAEKKEHSLVRKFFKQETRTLAEDTAIYAIFSHVRSRAERMSHLVEYHGEDVRSYNASLSALGSPAVGRRYGWLKWLLFGVVGVAVALWLKRKLGRASNTASLSVTSAFHEFKLAAGQWCENRLKGLNKYLLDEERWRQRLLKLSVGIDAFVSNSFSTFLEAGVEETIKKVHPLAPLGFALFEVGIKIANRVFLPADSVYASAPAPAFYTSVILSAGMHLICSQLPWGAAVFTHGAWNYLVRQQGRPIATGSLLSLFGAWTLEPPRETSPHFRTWKTHWYELPWALRGDWDTPLEGNFPFALEEGFVPRQIETWYVPKPLDDTLEVQNDIIEAPPSRVGSIYLFLPCLPMYAPQRCDQVLLEVIRGRLLVEAPMSPEEQELAWVIDDPEFSDGRRIARDDVGVVYTIGLSGCGLSEPQWFGTEKHYGRVPWGLPSDLFARMDDWEALFPAWLANIKESYKKQRALRAFEQYREAPPRLADREFTAVEVMVKTDEVLLKNGAFKPRPVLPVAPLVQVYCGPYVMEATRRLKILWDGVYDLGPELTCGMRYSVPLLGIWGCLTIKFGSGVTDFELNKWAARALTPPGSLRAHRQPEAHIIVAGDDSLVVLNLVVEGRTELYVLEGDFSMYDQSQSSGPLKHQREFAIRLGMPPEVANALYTISGADYSALGADGISKIRIRHPDRPMRATGGADTTFGNTVCSGHAWAHVLTRVAFKPDTHNTPAKYMVSYLIAAIEEGFTDLGLSLKLKVHRQFEDATFLKGMWFPHRSGQLFWGPLPSRICKLGKSLKDPRHLYRTRDDRRPSLLLATERFAHDLAMGLRPGVPVPLLREFVERYTLPSSHRARTFRERVAGQSAEPWKVTFTGQAGLGFDPTTPVDGYSFDALYRRYELTDFDFATMGRMVTASEVGTLLQHPGFERLAQVDYN